MAKNGKPKADDPALVEPAMTVLSDRALRDEDYATAAFDLNSKLGPIYDILRHGETRTPMAVAVYGDWGTGKTSAMRYLRGMLEKWRASGPEGRVRVQTVWFDPWKYHDREDVWRGLIAEVIIKTIDVGDLQPGEFVQRVTAAAKRFGGFLGRSFLHALAGLKVKAGAPGAGVEFGFAALRDVYDEYRAAAQPHKAYLNQFEETLRAWLREWLGPDERMVIFIDDLDRCMPEVCLEVLEALKLYLNLDRLIFVVGVDRDVVDQIVVEHYRLLGVTDAIKARKYLDKMFQVEVNVTPSERQVGDFFGKQLDDLDRLAGGYWDEMLSDEHRDVLMPVLRALSQHNPREVKRLLNSALLAGAAAARRYPETDEPRFAQGLQVFLVKRVFQAYEYAAPEWVSSDDGSRFFEEWSCVACANPGVAPLSGAAALEEERAEEAAPAAMSVSPSPSRRRSPRPVSAEQDSPEVAGPYRDFCREWVGRLEWGTLRRWLSDPDLLELMVVPFSGEVARFSSETVAPAARPEARPAPPSEGVAARAEAPAAAAGMPREITRALARQVRKPVDAVTAADLARVERLDLSGTHVSDLTPLQGLSGLQVLDLEGTPVSDLTPLQGLSSLRELDLTGTHVSVLMPLQGLSGLQIVTLTGTPVSDLTPLQGLASLKGLRLDGTPVSDLTLLQGLSALEWLDLEGTQVSDLTPLQGLSSLQRLNLTGTSVPAAQVEALQKALPDLKILGP